MDYKNELKKYFGDSKILIKSRYEASKNMFIYFSLIFFLNYFFVGAKFYDSIFLLTLPFTYFSFILTFCFFIFFYIKYTFDLKVINNMMIIILLVIMGLLFLLPLSGISL